jgi:hypothetical protein
MFELFFTLFTGGGAMGLGSILKIGAGWLDSKSAANEAKEKRKLLEKAENAKNAIEFQQALTGDGKEGMFARHTRRMLALIGVSTLAVCTIHCTLFPTDEFITLGSVASGEGVQSFSFLFGLFEIPRNDKPILLTLGHLAATNYIALNMILGFYFTPGGRK